MRSLRFLALALSLPLRLHAAGLSPGATLAPASQNRPVPLPVPESHAFINYRNDGEKQKKTANDENNPTTILIAKKAGNRIVPGQTVALQVKNADNTVSDEFEFARPV